jgi:hypothetical protein
MELIPDLEGKIANAENILKKQLDDDAIDLDNLATKLPDYRRD